MSLLDDLQKLSPQELQAVYHRVFNTDSGALLLEDLKNRFFFTAPTYSVQGPEVSNRNEGMRMAILHILTMLQPITPVSGAEVPPGSDD